MGNKKEERIKERQELYQSKMWKDLRKKLQMERPLCENCLKKGIIKPMEECHHRLSPFQKGITEEEKYIAEHHPGGTIKDLLDKYKD